MSLYKRSQSGEKYPEWREVTWEDYKGEFIVREYAGRWDEENNHPLDKNLERTDHFKNSSQADERARARVAELRATG